MIYLNTDKTKIAKALKFHTNGLTKYVADQVDKCNIVPIRKYLDKAKIKEILTGEPSRLLELHKEFLSLADYDLAEWNEYLLNRNKKKLEDFQKQIVNKYNPINAAIESIFNYKSYFSKKDATYYSAYNLAANLNVQTCVYCNRMYTKTVFKPRKITRPEFDHWFSKSKHPLLALSFYNLIPSCHVCNSSVKGTGDMSLIEHLHPYVDCEIDFRFSYYNKTYDTYGFKILSPENSKSKNTVDAFKIKEIYETHEDEMKDLRKIREVYSEHYLELLSNQFKDLTISKDEMYRLAFGVYINEKDFDKRPLSKMKRDILIELGIIK